MNKWIRWVVALIVLIVIILVAFLKIYFHVDFPKEEGSLSLPGLKTNVEVITDVYGVPHIYAENDHDLFFSLGYVHASQRLFQMDQTIRAAAGRLSEAFGSELLYTDIFLRTVGFYNIAQELQKHLRQEDLDIINAYVSGINTYIKLNEHNLPLEFRIARYKPLKWEPANCISFFRLMGWTLTQSWNAEIAFFKIIDVFGLEKTKEAMPVYPEKWPLTIPEYSTELADALSAFRRYSVASRKFLGMEASHIGSNNWAISGNRTTTGAPILCNDPHLGFSQPPVWFEAHLVSPGFNVAGVTFPGMPGVVIGHNQNIAWGFTNMMTDDVDFYIEKVSPDHHDEYFYDGKWQSISSREETIKVKGAPDTTITIRYTYHGPIISDIHKLLKDGKHIISMRWSGQDVSDEFRAVLGINRAKNWQEFSDAAQYYKVPGQNTAYADINGNIGLCPMGNIPIRKGGDRLLPLPGDSPEFEWKGYVPYEKMPFSFNPKRGFVASANVRIADDSFPYYISNHYEPPSRLQRIVEVLSEDKKFSIEDMKSLQFDDFSYHAREILPHFFEALSHVESLEAIEIRAYNTLKNWNYREDIYSIASTLFNTMFIEMIKAIYKDEMDLAGEGVFEQFLTFSNFSIRNSIALLEKGESSWFDDIRTNDIIERRNDILIKSFKNAVEFLKNNYTSNFSEWEWGKIHTLTHKHPMGNITLLNFIFKLNVGPFPSPGSGTTINSGEYSIYKPFDQIAGPSVRFIMPLDDLENIYSVLPTGQSGLPGHLHYDDQSTPYNNGEYKILSTNRFKLIQSGSKVLTLTPAKSDH